MNKIISSKKTETFITSRRNFLKQASIAVAGTVFPWTVVKSFAQTKYFPVVETTNGKLQGIDWGGINAFKGIHYGGSTAGKNRFMPPTPPEKWTGVRDSFGFGKICPQFPANPTHEYVRAINWDRHPGGMGEDCLTLNVWTPGINDGGKRPVLFSMHGGGFTTGSGNTLGFNGEPLARAGDAVVVTVNHRLNVFGYLHLGDFGGPSEFDTSGVVGIMDLVAALKWVQENIENFGGDPNNVIIFGQSGGGSKTYSLLGTPSAKGTFHRAGVQSGATLVLMEREQSIRSAEKVLSNLGINKRDFRKLQEVPWDKLLEASAGVRLTPVVDGKIIPSHPFGPVAPECSADIPMIIGTTLEEEVKRADNFDVTEADLEAYIKETYKENAERILHAYRRYYPNVLPFQLQGRIDTDCSQRRMAYAMAERKIAQGKAPVYMYIWNWPSPVYGGKFGAIHGVDVGLTFNNTRGMLTGHGPESEKMADILSSVWIAFAKTGNPNCSKVPDWPAYNTDTRPTMIFDLECRLENDPARELRLLWDEIKGPVIPA